MKIKNIIPLLFFVVSCGQANQNIQESQNKGTKEAIVDLIIENHDGEHVEFLNLYREAQQIPPDSLEELKLVQLLKTRNFKVTNWGRGNWMHGPRIVSIQMSNGSCMCTVDKLYKTIDDSVFIYEVTERLKCD